VSQGGLLTNEGRRIGNQRPAKTLAGKGVYVLFDAKCRKGREGVCVQEVSGVTCSSVEVVSNPQNAAQSLTMSPAETTSLPRLMVPATSGTCAATQRQRSERCVWK
jgi:hypothetical protein